MSTENITQAAAADLHKPLLDETRRALAQAIFHAMQVAGNPEEGYPSKLGQEALAERAGIARSTVAKYLSAKDSDESLVNPDLDTICKLAAALNIPPALLLMTPSDWLRLAQAATYAVASTQDSVVKQIITTLSRESLSAAKRGEISLRLAERLGVQSHRRAPITDTKDIPDRWLDAQAQLTRQSQLGILSATALPPLGTLNMEQRTILLSLCAILGAATNLK